MNVAIAEIIGIVSIVTIVGILLVTLPITLRLGRVMEEWVKIRAAGAADRAIVDGQGEQLRALSRHVEALEDRLALLAERQDFTESLVDSSSESRSIPSRMP